MKEKNEHLPIMGVLISPEEGEVMAREYEHEAVARAGYKIKSFIVPRECDASTKYFRTKIKGEK